MPASISRYDLLRFRLDRFTRALHGVETGELRALRRARVASRRLRELIPVLQLGAALTRKLARRLRRVRRRLGTVRELDVLLLVIQELEKSGGYPQVALARIAGEIRDARRAAWPKQAGKRAAVELKQVARSLGRVARKLEPGDAARQPGRTWRWVIDARVARRASHLKAVIEEAGAMYSPRRLHTVRIALKKLRYSVELAADASGRPAKADLQALKRGQDVLGRMHDLQVLIDRVRRLQASLLPPDLTEGRDLDTLLISLESTCRRLHARYIRDWATLVAICQRSAQKAAAGSRPTPVRRAG